MFIKVPSGPLLAYLSTMGRPELKNLDLDDAAVEVATQEVRSQHPEEPFPQDRAIARLAVLKFYVPNASGLKTGLSPFERAHVVHTEATSSSLREIIGVHIPAIKGAMQECSVAIGKEFKSVATVTGVAGEAVVTALRSASISRSQEQEHNRQQREAQHLERLRHDEHMAAQVEDALGTLTSAIIQGVRILAYLLLGLLLVLGLTAHAQTTTIVRGATKGTTTSGSVTATDVDTNHTAMDVNVVAGGAGGGLAQVQAGRASDGTFVNVGYFSGQLNLPVNCVVGCSGGASTPADTFSNPTTASLGMSFPMVWNGTSWDRLYGDKTNGAYVNIKAATTLAVTGTFWQATQPVSIATMPSTPVTGTFWQATQPVSGTFWQATQPVSGTVAFSNTTIATTNTGTFAVQAAATEADGANVTLGAKADAKSTATDTTPITAMSVLKQISASVQAPPSQAVTNAGTFAAQATLQTQTDTTMVGGVNVKEINAVAPLMGAGNTGTGSPRVTVATDQAAIATWGLGATGSAPPSGAQLMGGIASGATSGLMQGIPVCDSYAVVNIATATTTLIVTGVASRHVRICSLNLVAGAADNVAVIEGTGATCGTGSAGMAGGTTAASGWNFAANGGMTLGNGLGTVMRTATTGDSVCLVTSAAAQLSGGVSYAIY